MNIENKDEEQHRKRKASQFEDYWNNFFSKTRKSIIQELQIKQDIKSESSNISNDGPENPIFEEIVSRLYNIFVEMNGFIFTFHSAYQFFRKENTERIFNLIGLKSKYDDKQMILEDVTAEIESTYNEKPYFVLQVEMKRTYPDYTPGRGLCWIVSEFQAYYRGLHMIHEQNLMMDVQTWLDYVDPLEKVLEEAYTLMSKQKDQQYSEAEKLDSVRSIETKHKYFREEWENIELRNALIKTGEYKKTVVRDNIVLKDRWGSNYGFGTIFFSGKGSLDESPPMNYFMDNKATIPDGQYFHDTFSRENYAILGLILPFNSFYHSDSETPLTRSFCGAEIISATRHNNCILFSNEHFQPIDWPESQSQLKSTVKESLLQLTKKTTEILEEDWTFDTNKVTLKDVDKCLKKLIGKCKVNNKNCS